VHMAGGAFLSFHIELRQIRMELLELRARARMACAY
jgi:hypothetical protein